MPSPSPPSSSTPRPTTELPRETKSVLHLIRLLARELIRRWRHRAAETPSDESTVDAKSGNESCHIP